MGEIVAAMIGNLISKLPPKLRPIALGLVVAGIGYVFIWNWFLKEDDLAVGGVIPAIKVTSVEEVRCDKIVSNSGDVFHAPCSLPGRFNGDTTFRYSIEVLLKPTQNTIADKRYRVELWEDQVPREYGISGAHIRNVRWSQPEIESKTERNTIFMVIRDNQTEDIEKTVSIEVHECNPTSASPLYSC